MADLISSPSPSRSPTTDKITVTEAIRARRSIRHYLPDPIPTDQLRELLDLALEAPSSWNSQSRPIVVVSQQEGRDGPTWATGGQPHPQEVPVMLVFVAAASQAWRENREDIYEQARQSGAWNEEFIAMFKAAGLELQRDLEQRYLLREYALKDAMITASYLMFAATSMGLVMSPMNGWDEQKDRGPRRSAHCAADPPRQVYRGAPVPRVQVAGVDRLR